MLCFAFLIKVILFYYKLTDTVGTSSIVGSIGLILAKFELLFFVVVWAWCFWQHVLLWFYLETNGWTSSIDKPRNSHISLIEIN